jgi:ATP diphosphatase
LKIDPEFALRGTNTKFETRFRHVESSLRDDDRELNTVSIDEYETRWQAAKIDKV